MSYCCEEVKQMKVSMLESEDMHGISLLNGSFCPMCGKISQKDKEVPESPKSNDPSFCCQVMEYRVLPEGEHPDYFQIFYQSWSRRFFFSKSVDWRKEEPEGIPHLEWEFYYCIYCAKKLPVNLQQTWLEIVNQKFGVEKQFLWEKMLALVPEEFRTEEWWRKRRL